MGAHLASISACTAPLPAAAARVEACGAAARDQALAAFEAHFGPEARWVADQSTLSNDQREVRPAATTKPGD